MLKKILLMNVFALSFGSFQLCFADDVANTIFDEHMLKIRNQQQISMYILKNYDIDRSKPDQLKLMVQSRINIEKLVFEQWKKSFSKEFTTTEKDYFTVLYKSPLMKKFFQFNDNFATRKEVQDIIKANLDTKFKTISKDPSKPSAKK